MTKLIGFIIACLAVTGALLLAGAMLVGAKISIKTPATAISSPQLVPPVPTPAAAAEFVPQPAMVEPPFTPSAPSAPPIMSTPATSFSDSPEEPEELEKAYKAYLLEKGEEGL
jgi:hypothetical protein